jgi:GDP-4-dehydro-6-deoxy-D-mannose reductase
VRVLVTGADGFVGRHLCSLLEENGDTPVPLLGVDVRDGRALADAFSRARPQGIIHLAAVSSVADSQKSPVTTFEVNTLGTVNVCQATRELEPSPPLLLVSSGEVYGAIPPEQPATEQARTAPTSPYGASKLAAEIAGVQFAHSYGMPVVVARPFTHLGRGQAPTFAIPSFARQLAHARRGAVRATLKVGNLEAVRDFSHVRDVVAAYRVLLDRGVSGEVYNVSSGRGRSIRSILDELIALVGIEVDVQVDPARLRPSDIPNMVGDSSRLRALGWAPRFTVRDALLDVLEDSDAHAGMPQAS